MSLADYVTAVESGFRAHANGDAETAPPLHLTACDGAFHAKTARLTLDRTYVALKLNGNFPANPQRSGLPTIQGVIVLCDGVDGSVLAVMDSIEITRRRTAAATVLAARYLARNDCPDLALCGCGAQGRAQVEALVDALSIQRAFVWDIDGGAARDFADELSRELGIAVHAVDQIGDATRQCHLIVTATSSCIPFLTKDLVAPGTFVAAVGADNPGKSELSPDLMAGATIVVDLLGQASTMGDLHHAIAAGLLTVGDVHGELGEVIVGRKTGRTSAEQTIVFDSTGTALQDVAAAVAIWRRARDRNAGSTIELGTP